MATQQQPDASSGERAQFRAKLESIRLSDFEKPAGGVVELDAKLSLEEGFQQLIDRNLLSAPVWDAAHNQYVGFLDVRDLVSSVVHSVKHNSQAGGRGIRLGDVVKHSSASAANTEAKWQENASLTITYLARRNPFVPIKESQGCVLDVARLLSKPHQSQSRIRRVPIVNDQGKCTNVISESTLVRFLASHSSELPQLMNQVLEARSDIGSSPVLSISSEASALQALEIMDNKQRLGLAVVSPTGQLVGNISGKDLKAFIRTSNYGILMFPVMQFLNDLRQNIVDADMKTPTISVFPHHTLGTAVARLAATRVHRLFVVNNEQAFAPQRVISLYDILLEIMQE